MLDGAGRAPRSQFAARPPDRSTAQWLFFPARWTAGPATELRAAVGLGAAASIGLVTALAGLKAGHETAAIVAVWSAAVLAAAMLVCAAAHGYRNGGRVTGFSLSAAGVRRHRHLRLPEEQPWSAIQGVAVGEGGAAIRFSGGHWRLDDEILAWQRLLELVQDAKVAQRPPGPEPIACVAPTGAELLSGERIAVRAHGWMWSTLVDIVGGASVLWCVAQAPGWAAWHTAAFAGLLGAAIARRAWEGARHKPGAIVAGPTGLHLHLRDRVAEVTWSDIWEVRRVDNRFQLMTAAGAVTLDLRRRDEARIAALIAHCPAWRRDDDEGKGL